MRIGIWIVTRYGLLSTVSHKGPLRIFYKEYNFELNYFAKYVVAGERELCDFGLFNLEDYMPEIPCAEDVCSATNHSGLVAGDWRRHCPQCEVLAFKNYFFAVQS